MQKRCRFGNTFQHFSGYSTEYLFGNPQEYTINFEWIVYIFMVGIDQETIN